MKRILGYFQVLQFEGYDVKRYIKNVFKYNKKQNPDFSLKMYLLIFTYILLNLFLIFLSTKFFIFKGLIISTVVLYLISPLMIVISYCLIFPIDSYLKVRLMKQAKKVRLNFKNLKVIGISGSYGKTSTKEIISFLLSKKYRVIKTPGNINTLEGISRFLINNLSSEYDYLIVEMGEYKLGDIEKIMKLIIPDYTLITSIGIQHLERFKTIDNIARTLAESVIFLHSGGKSIAHIDLKEYFDDLKINQCSIKYFSDKDISDIKYSKKGSNFILKFEGKKYNIRTNLLGHHNILNIISSIVLLNDLGFSTYDLVEYIKDIPQVEHRLQILRDDGELCIIDDAYNGNPVGFENASAVLRDFISNGNKVIITPGLVELGNKEFDENYKAGKVFASSCNFIILIGSIENNRIKGVYKGLRREGFSKKSIKFSKSLDEAVKILEGIKKGDDIVLFLNDLPKNLIS